MGQEAVTWSVPRQEGDGPAVEFADNDGAGRKAKGRVTLHSAHVGQPLYGVEACAANDSQDGCCPTIRHPCRFRGPRGSTGQEKGDGQRKRGHRCPPRASVEMAGIEPASEEFDPGWLYKRSRPSPSRRGCLRPTGFSPSQPIRGFPGLGRPHRRQASCAPL